MSIGAIAPILVSTFMSHVVSRVVTQWTGNEMYGAIAGMAAGGFVGTMTAGAGAAASPQAGGTQTAAGSTQAGVSGATANYLPLDNVDTGSLLADTSQSYTGASGSTSASGTSQMPVSQPVSTQAAAPATAAAPGQPPPAATTKTGGVKGFFDKLTPQDYLNYGGYIAQGIQEQSNADRLRQHYENQLALDEARFEEEKKQREEQSAYGVERSGRSVPLDIKDKLNKINQSTSFNTLGNLLYVPKTNQGYISESKETEEQRPLIT